MQATTNPPHTSSASTASTLTGSVTLVQERRFQLVDERGVAHAFVLAADATADPEALHALARSGQRIAVSFRESTSGSLTHVATRIEAAG